MDDLRVVTRNDWREARKALLAKEKEFTRQRDAVSAERRQLPVVRLDKEYLFDGPSGPVSLRDLFQGRRQLIVYHFMFLGEWDEGCPSCSHFADNFDGLVPHLGARDTAFVTVSRAPIAKIEAFKRRMGWAFPWVSSGRSDFNYDFHVTLDDAQGSVEYNFEPAAPLKAAGKVWMDELPGLSVFLRRGEDVFHTYSVYSRGLDLLINTYNYLDLTPLGRQEEGLPWSQAWIKHHDKYAVESEACRCHADTAERPQS